MKQPCMSKQHLQLIPKKTKHSLLRIISDDKRKHGINAVNKTCSLSPRLAGMEWQAWNGRHGMAGMDWQACNGRI